MSTTRHDFRDTGQAAASQPTATVESRIATDIAHSMALGLCYDQARSAAIDDWVEDWHRESRARLGYR